MNTINSVGGGQVDRNGKHCLICPWYLYYIGIYNVYIRVHISLFFLISK